MYVYIYIYIYIHLLAHLTRAFKNHVNLVLCIIRSDWEDIKLHVLDPFNLQRVNKLSELC